MAITDQEKQEIKNDVLDAIKSESQSVDELPVVESLDGITSLPAMRGEELVSAPISLLSKPATDAAALAKTATNNANTATANANTATTNANNATTRANEATTSANQAAQNANQAAETVVDYVSRATLGLKGATARFDGITDVNNFNVSLCTEEGGTVVFNTYFKVFLYYHNGGYYQNWQSAQRPMSLYMDGTTMLKDKIYLLGGTGYVWDPEENTLVEFSGSGSGSGFYNVTTEQPLESGYYDKDTAIGALANADIKDENKLGMILTFEKSAGVWVDYRFVSTDPATFLIPASWEEYGSGKIKSISLNGQNLEPDVNGNVAITFDQISVDESLDEESSNPVQNAAVTAKMKQLEDGSVGGVEVIEGEDKNTLNILGVTGNVIASAEFSGGGGGGGGGSTASRIIITAALDKSQVKEGGNAMLTYSYNHVNADGESDGIKANITVTVQRGTTQTFQQTYNNVSAGTFTLDISDYLLAGTVDVYVKAVAVTAEGTQQTKQAYTSISVVTLLLTSSYNLGSTIADGGYKNTDTIEIPFTITGSGTKDVSMYIDGSETPTTQTINKSGTINGSFTIKGSSLTAGRHTVQLVAERNGLLSDSIYIDILKAGLNAPFVGIKYTDKSGTILFSNHLTPTLKVGQYEEMKFEYIAYDPNTTPASVQELQNGVAVRTLSIPRSMQTYVNRFTTQGTVQVQFVCRTTKYNFKVDVTESDVAVGEATQGLVLRLSAAGRSNDEENPANWSYGDIKTTFENVDWKSSGWFGDVLRLRNGAKAIIDYKPFETDVAKDGCTIEMEFTISNVVDRNANVITCLNGTKGFQVTAEEASMYTGSTKEVEDDEGNKVVTNVGVGSKFASDMLLKVAFVIGKRTEGRLIELYVNGIRSKADIYAEGDDFQQDVAQGITLDSSFADIDARVVRVYNRAITDDEELGNYIVDRPTSSEMSDLFLANDVLNEDGTSIDIDKLRAKGKGVLLFVRTGGLDPVNAENNKDTDFLADVYFYSPFGKEYDFVLKNCYIRIQGTSSTKYPRKNYRIYFAKGTSPELYVNGVLQGGKNKYAMRPGSIPINLFCMKCDFSDSSMTHNTGGAKLFNELFKELALLTPAQEIDGNIRASIDGFPIDIFAAETIDEVPQYYGQYNFNNEKSNSGPLFGMEGVIGADGKEVEWDCPITFEFLNNMQKLCLFQVDDDLDAQLENEFDDALEFNYPKDLYWTQAVATKEEGDVCSEKHKTAVKRLFSWIRDCIPAGADLKNYKNIASFKSEKFKNEISQYFNLNFLLTYYLFTDYFVLVDQRAKNMLMRTWDGLVWFITYYDGDTALLGRNDSFLAYLYTVSRETWDSEKSKYAFEGHDSWLWCLVLANFETELKACASSMREKLTVERALAMFNDEQSGNWSERQYNKSGHFKYIIPQVEGVDVKGTLTKYPYIYALQGSREAHRTHTIRNRFALLDAKYETGAYRSDNIDMYMSRTATETANTIVVTSNEDYYFGYGTNNQPTLQASQEAKEDETVTLTFRNAFTVNDPIRVYGASRMKELDMRGAANNLTGDLNLNKCTVLQKLDISTTGNGSSGWCAVIDKCTQLRDINLNGQKNARTGTLSSSELNFTNQTKLERMDAGGVEVQGVVFAEGAPIVYARIPGSVKTLRLEYLPLLTSSGLVVEDYTNVETFRFAVCPNLNWETLLSRCTNVRRIRVIGIDTEGDGSLLERYISKGGVDADGNATDTCSLVGTYRLTRYIDEAVYQSYVEHYPELNIIQPEFTTIMFDDTVGDSANITNLDNGSGYESGIAYEASGHISKILSKRHRCLVKKTGAGEVTAFQLHDTNSNYYADADNHELASPAILTGTEGNVMMFEPHYWYKGINDFLNKKKYALYSANDECPTMAESVKVLQSEMTVKKGYAVRSSVDYSTIAEAETAVSANSYCTVNVKGYKQVRYPSMGSALYGAVLMDANGNIVKRMKATSDSGLLDGMYCFTSIPDDAVTLAFTIVNTADFDFVLLTKSTRLEAIEPDWVEHEECMVGVYEALLKDDFLFSVSGVVSTGNVSTADFKVYARNRGTGWQLVDYEMSKDVANLFFAKYGERDSQGVCGYGTSTNARSNGATNATGMTDTHSKKGAPTDNSAYVTVDGTEKNISSPNVMGYENWQGNKAEWMDKIDFNKTTVNYRWTIELSDGSIRELQGPKQTGDLYPKCVIHGRYMDTMVALAGGSTSTYYYDNCYQAGSTARVVCRSNVGANASGGVSCAGADSGSASVSAYIGSRLAFRGIIKWARSVSAYKAISEID